MRSSCAPVASLFLQRRFLAFAEFGFSGQRPLAHSIGGTRDCAGGTHIRPKVRRRGVAQRVAAAVRSPMVVSGVPAVPNVVSRLHRSDGRGAAAWVPAVRMVLPQTHVTAVRRRRKVAGHVDAVVVVVGIPGTSACACACACACASTPVTVTTAVTTSSIHVRQGRRGRRGACQRQRLHLDAHTSKPVGRGGRRALVVVPFVRGRLAARPGRLCAPCAGRLVSAAGRRKGRAAGAAQRLGRLWRRPRRGRPPSAPRRRVVAAVRHDPGVRVADGVRRHFRRWSVGRCSVRPPTTVARAGV